MHLNYQSWIAELKSLFPEPDEYELARAIYSFESAYEDRMTPTDGWRLR